MKTIFFILLLASFLQITILPVSLVLIILIARSFIISSKENLYLAFIFGLLISHLQFTPVGLTSVFYLLSVQTLNLWSKFPISNNLLIIFSYIILVLFLNDLFFSWITKSSFQIWPKILVEGLLIIPIYLILTHERI